MDHSIKTSFRSGDPLNKSNQCYKNELKKGYSRPVTEIMQIDKTQHGCSISAVFLYVDVFFGGGFTEHMMKMFP